jgi:hypothetical protein
MFYGGQDTSKMIAVDLTPHDTINLVKTGVSQGLMDQNSGNRYMPVNMEIEHTDILRANSLSVKFIAFKTPQTLE